LSKGYETFQKHDNSRDEHIDSLLVTIMRHEKETGQAIDAKFVTWRGMMTKVVADAQDDGTLSWRYTNMRRSWLRRLMTVTGELVRWVRGSRY
jgi:hypothetical protein